MIAFVFPGQGSQKPNMGAPWKEGKSWKYVEIASEVSSLDINHLLLHADADELLQTHHAQLATFVLSMMAMEELSSLNIHPQAVAGHSLGEFSALVAAGILSFEEACQVVTARGQAMRKATLQKEGSMTAIIGLAEDLVEKACAETASDVWVANYNTDGQVILAGQKEALALASEKALQFGAKRTLPLPVSGAFHTPYMEEAAPALAEIFEKVTWKSAIVPCVANTDAAIHMNGLQWKDLSFQQLTSPVRWTQTVLTLWEYGIRTFIEIGPGTVLTNLIKRSQKEATCISFSSPQDSKHVESFASSPPIHDEGTMGETLHIDERLVLSETTGLFTLLEPDIMPSVNTWVHAGAPLGKVGTTEVYSKFSGILMKIIALPGERVSKGQPIAWIHLDEDKGVHSE